MIFCTILSNHTEGYEATAERMEKRALSILGCLGFDSARSEVGITVSYWKDLDAINEWKKDLEHLKAKQKGKEQWYDHYTLRIAKVEIEY